MNWNASTIDNLRRHFTEGFAARDIAEPLVSFDACTAVSEVMELMDKRTFDVVGVRLLTAALYDLAAELLNLRCGSFSEPVIEGIS